MERTEKISDHTETPLSFLALGDSYTIGEGVETHAGWPAILQDTLQKTGVPMLTPRIIARTGWTTAELMTAMAEEDMEPPYDLVSLLIGVNNQYRGPDRGYDLEDYKKDFSVLLSQAIDLAGGKSNRVLVVSIPDYSVTPFVGEQNKAKVSLEIDNYNQVKKQLSDEAGVLYLNITPISQMAANEPDLLAADLLHPSGFMYKKWVAEMLPLVLEVLKQ